MDTFLNLPYLTIEKSDSLSFSHVFQPILSLQNETIYGFESLIRGKEFQNPQLLFAMAEQQKKKLLLDFSSIMQSITSFDQWIPAKDSDMHLTVNIFPSTMLEPSFLWFMENLQKKVNIPPKQIIFEINEAETVENLTKFQGKIRYLKEAGFLIALDDLGKGQSSLKASLEIDPDMVKLDQYFSIDLEKSIKKQHFLAWITSYFKEIGTQVTLEGIETQAQFTIAKQIGVQYGQGYHLGRPRPLISKS